MEKGELIGRGRTASVYSYGEGRVIKRFEDWVPMEWVQYELDVCIAVYDSGVPSPRVYGPVQGSESKEIIYERIEGISMLKQMQANPFTGLYHARQLARLHFKIHQSVTDRLPRQKDKLLGSIHHAKDILGERLEDTVRILEKLPELNRVCHGDFHPDNVLVSKDSSIAIDWTNACSGHPYGDVMRTCLMLRSSGSSSGASKMLLLLEKHIKGMFLSHYLKEYRRLSRATQWEIEEWFLPVAAARLNERIPGEREWLLQWIDDRLGWL